MRKNLINMLILVMIVFASCEKYDEVHEEYVQDGEIVYSVKPDSIEVLPGLNRCKVTTEMAVTPNLDKLVIEWNDEQQITDVPTDTDTAYMNVEIANLEEGSVLFKVYSLDTDGNASVIVNAFGNVYGERYQSSLLQRGVTEIKSVKEGAIVYFKSNPEKSVGVELTYTDNDDAIQTVRVEVSDEEVVLENAKFGSELNYRTLYLPEENSLDTIPTAATVSMTIPDPELKEKAVELSASSVMNLDNDTEGAGWGNGDGGLFDDKYTTYGAYEAGYPQILTIDMGEVLPLTRLKLWSRLNSDGHYFGKGNANKIRLFGAAEMPASTDLNDWQLLGTYEFTKPSEGEDVTDDDKAFAEAGFECIIENNPEVRYVRVVVDETFEQTSYMYIGDLKFYGMMY
ncbi:hypothetical protein EYV94_08275 [Puteibacter caeruleilacunae]|nr:hypothetical protein EYV94_08275 [Puteibacter caeruleilacunae]